MLNGVSYPHGSFFYAKTMTYSDPSITKVTIADYSKYMYSSIILYAHASGVTRKLEVEITDIPLNAAFLLCMESSKNGSHNSGLTVTLKSQEGHESSIQIVDTGQRVLGVYCNSDGFGTAGISK